MTPVSLLWAAWLLLPRLASPNFSPTYFSRGGRTWQHEAPGGCSVVGGTV